MKKEIAGQSGVTLVELIIALSLLAVVIALGYNYYFFGASTFERGEGRANVQQNIRLAADFMSNQLRYAQNMEILDAPPDPGSYEDDYNYILVSNEGQITHVEEGDEKNLLSPISQGLNFNLGFDTATVQDAEGEEVKAGEGKALSFSIETGESEYNIESANYLRHLEGSIEGEEGVALRYKVHDWAPTEEYEGEFEFLEEEDYSGCC